MTEQQRLTKITRWCAWMVTPAVRVIDLLPAWIPLPVRKLPLLAVCKLFSLHLAAMRHAGYGDA